MICSSSFMPHMQPTREELLSAPPPFSDGEVRVTATDYRSWGDVLDSDHRPVCATLEISLPVTDAAKKRALVSALLAEHKAPSLALAHAIDGPQATLSTDAVRLHAAHMPEQMVLLSNGGAVPLEYAIVAVDDGTLSPGDVAVEVRPVRGVVQPHADAPIHVSAVPRGAGDAGAYVAGPQEVQFRVTIGTEYSAGGAGGKGVVKELHFTALVLPEFAQDDKF